MSDEQRVRTMAGWIGVEISRSRVRTPGKAGYGLYRVRTSQHQRVRRTTVSPGSSETTEPYWVPSPWTAYAFTLTEIETEIETAISAGIPMGPSDLWLRPADGGAPVGVTTRWTSAYRGRRDLGVMRGEHVNCPHDPEGRDDNLLSSMICSPADTGRETVRSRQRAANAAFQAEHAPRRAAGKAAYHARRLGPQTTGKRGAFKRSEPDGADPVGK